MNWRPILLHRFVLVPLVLVVLTAAWNVYVSLHNGGLIVGEVRDAGGAPVADAVVIFYDRNLVTFRENQRTRTDAAGRFRFENNLSHLGQLEAQTADGRHSERRLIRLWFRSQNFELDAPLVVRPQG